ncbi:MAG: L,D-transpeptidase family protein [Lachnospiraceae bacterium]|nr:L,D-transpeptidase family protein [Lachnospiraceae bacterium]
MGNHNLHKKIISCILALGMASGLCACAGKNAASDDGLFASKQEATDSPEWVTTLESAQDDSVKQLFIVAGMAEDSTAATVSMHERDKDGNWKQILSTPGYVGKNGLCADEAHAEGCGQTPMGVYRFTKAFGIEDDPGCAMEYTKVDDDIFWSGDDREGMHYNEMINIKDFPDLDMENSEHIIDYDYQYRYCLNIGFNEDGTPGRGSAIFLHCLGSYKPYTGGCVALPENKMKLVMQKVDPECVVIIGTVESLTGSSEISW